MAVRVDPTELPGVQVLQPDLYPDPRGFFAEVFHAGRYSEAGLPGPFVQINQSRSIAGVLRGLHYQLHAPQAKLIAVMRGTIFDVAVDIRRGSPTFGRFAARTLSAENRLQMYIPAGFAHGFCVVGAEADVVYLCSDLYAPGDECGICWNDPDLAIPWPIAAPVLSDKDRHLPRLGEIPPDRLPAH